MKVNNQNIIQIELTNEEAANIKNSLNSIDNFSHKKQEETVKSLALKIDNNLSLGVR